MGVGPPDKILKFADGWIIFPLFNRLIAAIETLPGFGQTWCMHQRGLLDDSREQACLRDTHCQGPFFFLFGGIEAIFQVVHNSRALRDSPH